jgi:hypothetical protein
MEHKALMVFARANGISEEQLWSLITIGHSGRVTDYGKALQREMLEEEFQQGWGGWPLPAKIRHLLDRVVKLVA